MTTFERSLESTLKKCLKFSPCFIKLGNFTEVIFLFNFLIEQALVHLLDVSCFNKDVLEITKI